MSLINQALKKAQRERNHPPTPEATGPVPRQPGELRPTHAESRRAYQGLQWLVGGGILITGIVAAVALALVLMSPKPAAPEAPTDDSIAVRISLPRPSSEPAPASESPAEEVADMAEASAMLDSSSTKETFSEAPVVSVPSVPQRVEVPKLSEDSTPPAVAQEEVTDMEPLGEPSAVIVSVSPAPAPVVPSSPKPKVESGPQAESPLSQPVAVAGEKAAPPPAPPPDTPLPGAEPNPKVLAFLESSRITGIKVAGVHSRLLMNNQIYRSDDIVHADTQLRIKEIAPNEILFVDESGIQYRKQFRR